MPYLTTHPPEDDAWRVGDRLPGVAHYFGVATEFNGRSKCWADAPADGTRRAAAEDRLCPDCDSWYWQHVSIPLVETTPGG